jgi:hypothetical protein
MALLRGLVSVSVVACLTADTRVMQSPPTAQKPGQAVILGKVVEAGTTTGVAGALVTLSGAPQTVTIASGQQLPIRPSDLNRVTADAQGQFLFRDVVPGSYTMTATAAGYVPGQYGQPRIIQIRRTLDLIRTVEITESDRVVPASIPMFRKGGISGRVLDDAGEPAVGIDVTIIARMTDWGGPVSQVTTTALTDDRGLYHVDLVPGDYVVGVLAATTTVPSSAVQGFQQALAQGGEAQQAYLSQIIANGAVLPRGIGARIGSMHVSQFGDRNAPVVPPVTSDGKSTWFFPSVFHPASLSAAEAVVISVGPGEEKTGVDVQLRPMPARRVSGRLTGPAGIGPSVALRLVPRDPSVTRTSPATFIDTPMAMADEHGDFVFVGIAPGNYTLVVIRPPSTAANPLAWATETVTLGDTDVSGLQVQLQMGATVSGRIVVEGGGAPPVTAWRNVTVAARPVPGSPGAYQLRNNAGPVDAALSFTTRQSIPGPHMMTVSGLPGGWILKSITLNGENIADKTFILGPAGINGVVVTITNQISNVTGIVRDNEGQPGSRATVAVFPADKSLWRLPGMASRRVQTAAPGRDGRYTFRGLPAGEYYLVAADWPSADFSDAAVLTAVMPHALKITLADGESRTHDLRMAVVR